MKKFTIFESSIIGLFIGVIASTYLVFLNSTNAFVGKILSWISLIPVLNLFNISFDKTLFIPFTFIIAVYTIYGLIIGIIIKKRDKIPAVITGLVLLLIISIGVEQGGNLIIQNKSPEYDNSYEASVIKTISKTPEQYFGEEAVGDLNSDGKNDVAFIIPRDDDKEGTIYYMAAALKDGKGHTGTNLIFLGNKIEPQKIYIENGTISVESSTKKIYAQVIDGKLEQIKTPVGNNEATSTTIQN